MPHYQAATRSNYFRVKNAVAFEAWCARCALRFWTDDRDGPTNGWYAITANNELQHPWPQQLTDDDSGNLIEIDIAVELARHLDPRDVAVLIEIRHMGMRSIMGHATAVRADGWAVRIDLDDIYEQAVEVFGEDINITEATG